jgi:hypothetical protein
MGSLRVKFNVTFTRDNEKHTVGGQDSEPNFVFPLRWTTIAYRLVLGYPPFQMTTMTC